MYNDEDRCSSPKRGITNCNAIGSFHAALSAEVLSVQTDVIRVLQGKLEGCTVNSQGVILNHTTYYLNPDAHIFYSGSSSHQPLCPSDLTVHVSFGS